MRKYLKSFVLGLFKYSIKKKIRYFNGGLVFSQVFKGFKTIKQCQIMKGFSEFEDLKDFDRKQNLKIAKLLKSPNVK